MGFDADYACATGRAAVLFACYLYYCLDPLTRMGPVSVCVEVWRCIADFQVLLSGSGSGLWMEAWRSGSRRCWRCWQCRTRALTVRRPHAEEGGAPV